MSLQKQFFMSNLVLFCKKLIHNSNIADELDLRNQRRGRPMRRARERGRRRGRGPVRGRGRGTDADAPANPSRRRRRLRPFNSWRKMPPMVGNRLSRSGLRMQRFSSLKWSLLSDNLELPTFPLVQPPLFNFLCYSLQAISSYTWLERQIG